MFYRPFYNHFLRRHHTISCPVSEFKFCYVLSCPGDIVGWPRPAGKPAHQQTAPQYLNWPPGVLCLRERNRKLASRGRLNELGQPMRETHYPFQDVRTAWLACSIGYVHFWHVLCFSLFFLGKKLTKYILYAHTHTLVWPRCVLPLWMLKMPSYTQCRAMFLLTFLFLSQCQLSVLVI